MTSRGSNRTKDIPIVHTAPNSFVPAPPSLSGGMDGAVGSSSSGNTQRSRTRPTRGQSNTSVSDTDMSRSTRTSRSSDMRLNGSSVKGNGSISMGDRMILTNRMPDGRTVTIKGIISDTIEDGSDGDSDMVDIPTSKGVPPAMSAPSNSIPSAPSVSPTHSHPSRTASPHTNGGGSPAASVESDDEQMIDSTATAASSSRRPIPANSVSRGMKREREDGQSPSPDPVMDDVTMSEQKASDLVLVRRAPFTVPPLPPPKKRIVMEDVRRFQRPALLRHMLTEERRIVQVRPIINGIPYAEQLIDDTMLLKRYLPTAPPSTTLTSQPSASSIMSPMMISRASLIGSAHTSTRQMSLPHAALSSARMLGGNRMHSPPGSPKGGRSVVGNSGVMPPTPFMMRQSSALTIPMQSQQLEGPPTNIVTQLIPYGRIQIVPARAKPVLCATSVPLSQYSSAHSWYMPHTQPSVLYITLELPGHVDFEIRVSNVLLLPPKIDQQRMDQQQKLIDEGKLVATNVLPLNVMGQLKGAKAVAAATIAASASKLSPYRGRVLRQRNRVGGHLQRKRCYQTELQQLESQDDSNMSEHVPPPRMDAVSRDVALEYGRISRFGRPRLQDVRVSIKSRGKTLVPTPPHVEEKLVLNKTPLLPNELIIANADREREQLRLHPPRNRTVLSLPSVNITGLPAKGVESVFVPEGPTTLTASRPHIDFEFGSISLERLKPRLGGWSIRRDLTNQLAHTYRRVSPEEIIEHVQKGESNEYTDTPAVKLETDRPTTPNIKLEPNTVKVKLEPIPTNDIAKGAKLDGTLIPTTVVAASLGVAEGEKPPSVDPFKSPFSTVYEPADLASSQHDIVEAGDVIRLVLNIPAAPVTPKSKPILGMRYELTIEGLRVLPTADAPTFPTPLDMYRAGTAPKELILEDAHRTRITCSRVPSEQLAGNLLTHWSDLGRPNQKREPIILPESILPGSDEDEASSSEEEDLQGNIVEKKKSIPSAAELSYRALVDHPQSNMSEYYSILEQPLNDSEQEENDELERSDSSEEEEPDWTSESESVGSDPHASDNEYHSDHGKDSDDESPRKGRIAPNSGSKNRIRSGVVKANVIERVSSSKQLPPSRPSGSRTVKPDPTRQPTGALSANNLQMMETGDEEQGGSDEVWACCDKVSTQTKTDGATRNMRASVLIIHL
jgi:hypothetical protein